MNERSFIVNTYSPTGEFSVIMSLKSAFHRFCVTAGHAHPAAVGFQDLVSNVASTACCDMTGTGCAGETRLSKESGAGCQMNCPIAATALAMHIA